MNNIFELADSYEESTTKNQEPLWLQNLNPEQKQAVIATDGPLLVLAGAGTGKTRVLVSRLAYLIFSNIAKPWNCLAVTFTNKASNEMRERVYEMTGVEAANLWLGTFHSVCVRILRRNAERVGLKSNFTIIDDNDQQRLVNTIMQDMNIDTKKYLPKIMSSIFSRWKDQALTSDKINHQVNGYDYADNQALKVYNEYNNRLKIMNACDFGDLLLHCITLFIRNNEILSLYQDKFRYIMVDEYQDTNVAQYLWLRLLAMKHKNICCVGDDDQSIYSWRGAEIANILNFEKDFSSAKIIRLEKNYRSTKNILDSASNLICFNKQRLGKKLYPANNTNDNTDDNIKLLKNLTSSEEVINIIEEIEDEQRNKIPLSQMAILVRTASLTRDFEEKLVGYGIPYRVIGGLRFYERMEIRDVIAYLRVLVQPDDSLAFERIINKPKRGIGDKTVKTIADYARDNNLSYFASTKKLIEINKLSPKVCQTLNELLQGFNKWQLLLNEESPKNLVKIILEETGYLKMWQQDKSIEAKSRLENIQELLGVLNDSFTNINEFLEYVSLVMEKNATNADDYLSIMTIHAAKGLEFDCVFLPAWEENIFPNAMTLSENGENGVEEERRLAYVAITRARKKVVISFAYSRFMYGSWQNNQFSRFIDEIGLDNLAKNIGDKHNLYDELAEKSFDWNQMYNKKTLSKNTSFNIGDKVFHKRFGNGIIVNIDTDKLDIKFDDNGFKKIMSNFVETLK